MRKIRIIAFVILSISIFSCSSEDEQSSNNLPGTNLPSNIKIRSFDFLGNPNSITNYQLLYENEKLISIKEGLIEYRFQYSGENLIRLEYGINNGTDPFSLFNEIDLEYNNDILVRYYANSNGIYYRSDLEYTGNQIHRDNYSYNSQFNTDYSYVYSDILTLNVNNIIHLDDLADNYPYQIEYTFSNTNSVFKSLSNIRELGIISTGRTEYINSIFNSELYLFIGTNNLSTRNRISNIDNSEGDGIWEYEIDYNSQGLVEKIEVYGDILNTGENILLIDCTVEY